jgi:hypothetical protein
VGREALEAAVVQWPLLHEALFPLSLSSLKNKERGGRGGEGGNSSSSSSSSATHSLLTPTAQMKELSLNINAVQDAMKGGDGHVIESDAGPGREKVVTRKEREEGLQYVDEHLYNIQFSVAKYLH